VKRRGILLAGGTGSRLRPATTVVSKQLLPVYDKPLVYYPLSVLMLAGIREVVLVSDPRQLPLFEALLGDGGQWGMTITYAAQERPEGIPQALTIAGPFLDGAPLALILGDNLFFGTDLPEVLRRVRDDDRDTIFAYQVVDPRGFGTVTLDAAARPIRLDEKPAVPDTPWAIPGLYFLRNDTLAMVPGLAKSARGELEIIDVLRLCLARGSLVVERLGRGTAWLDSGTAEALLEASQFVHVLEKRTGLKIACPEEIAFRMGFIDRTHLQALARDLRGSEYGRYLEGIVAEAPLSEVAPGGR
jgi:glucose-1-phosphate thymidylyltransferase